LMLCFLEDMAIVLVIGYELDFTKNEIKNGPTAMSVWA